MSRNTAWKRRLCRTIGFALTIALITLYSAANALGMEERVLHWTGVDVVTNDFALTEEVRRAVGISPMDEIAIDSPRLKKACDMVRSSYPSYIVGCTAVAMAGARALYAVELSHAKPPQPVEPPCPVAGTSRDFNQLIALVEHERNMLSEQAENEPSPEFVNRDGVLDSAGAAAHARSMKYFEQATRLGPEISLAAQSCDAGIRRNGLLLMNYVGQPAQAVRFAIASMQHTNILVRNVAMRLLSSFHDYVPSDQKKGLVLSACEALYIESFFDRNKALSVLRSLLNANRSLVAYVEPHCRSHIAEIARHSESEQIGAQAKLITEIFHSEEFIVP